MEKGTTSRLAAMLAALVLAVPAAHAAGARGIVTLGDGTGSELARRAADECRQAAAEPSSRALPRLDRALALAERAVAANPGDAKAHFAIFCSLGRRAELEGAGVNAISSLSRMRDAIDEALALEPRFIDALVAKGRMLAKLPWMLGGDADEGERLIRHALKLDPDSAVARLQLAHLLAEQGEESGARRFARAAMVLAERSDQRQVQEEASTLVAHLEG